MTLIWNSGREMICPCRQIHRRQSTRVAAPARVAFACSLAGPGPPVRGCHPSAEMSVRLWGIALAPNKAYKLTVPEDVELQINQACLGPESTVRCFFPSFFLPTAVPIVLCRGVGAAPHCSGCCALLQRRCR